MLNGDKEPDATRVLYLKGNFMEQNFYSSEEFDRMLAEMKAHQRRDVLLRIDEILTALDTASPAADQWKAARKSVQLVEGGRFAAMAGVPAGAVHGESAHSLSGP